MRTTIDLPEELLRQAKIRAVATGTTLKDLITRYVEQGLGAGPLTSEAINPESKRRTAPPVAIARRGVAIPALTNAELDLADDALAGAGDVRPA